MNQHTFISRVRSILSDNNAPRMSYAERSGSGIDEGRIALAPTGFNRVFKCKARRKYADYKVTLLVDNSGSMNGEKMDYAAKVVHALWYALKTAGVTPAVYGFNILFYKIATEYLESISRLYSFMDGRCDSSQGVINSHPAGDGNHDGYAVRLAVDSMLADNHEGGKVLLVFSDGSPACCSSGCGNPGCFPCDDAYNLRSDLVKSIAYARRRGVTCLAVGIRTDAPAKFYGASQSVCVDDLSALYTQTAALLERNLVRG